MNLSIVVVSWRSRDLLQRCLTALGASTPGAECVVIENGSRDGTAAMVESGFPGVRLVDSPSNLGYAGGCNRGLAASSGDAVLFLNPDVEVTPGSVQALVAVLESDERIGAVGGLLVHRDGQPQRRYAPRPFPTVGNLARWVLVPGERRGELSPGGPAITDVDQVAGACLLARRSALEEIGGFDHGFWPVWFEDVDLCLRLRQAGYRVVHHAGARFAHEGGGCIRMMEARDHYTAWYRSIHRYARKQHGTLAGIWIRTLTVVGAALRLAGTLLPGGAIPYGRGPRVTAYLRVATRSVTGWPKASQSMS
jgi:GT2 family glycosyltransferase